MAWTHSKFGRFEIVGELGRRPGATLHRARDPREGRDVVVTAIEIDDRAAGEEHAEILRRLREDVETARPLTHPSLVAVYEFDPGDRNRPAFVATEFVPGPTLEQLIATEGALSPDWSLAAIDGLAGARAAAREVGLGRFDLCPADVRICATNGVAKIAEPHLAYGAPGAPTERPPAYLAPERVAGRAGDHRSDLYALSVILYQMLCGQRPFADGATASNEAPQPITRRARELCPAFDEFFERALATDPVDRFPDLASFRRATHELRRQQRLFERRGLARDRVEDGRAVSREAGDGAVATEPVPAASVPEDVRPTELATRATPLAQVEAQPATRRAAALGAAALLLVAIVVAVTWTKDRSLPENVTPPSQATAPERETEPPPPSAPRATVSAKGPVAKPAAPKPPPKAKPTPRPPTSARAVEPAVVPDLAPPAEAAPTPREVEAVATRKEIAPPVVGPAQVQVRLENSFKLGKLTLLLDGEPTLTADLEAGAGRWRRILGQPARVSEHVLDVPAGSHTITARVHNAVKERDHEATLAVDLAAGRSYDLRVIAGRSLGKRLVLKLEPIARENAD